MRTFPKQGRDFDIQVHEAHRSPPNFTILYANYILINLGEKKPIRKKHWSERDSINKREKKEDLE